MAFAINVRSDNDSSNGIRSLWERCGTLEASPSMSAMQYPPHITLAVYDEIDLTDLYSGFDAALQNLGRMTIRFESLGYFEAPNAIVIWAAPVVPEEFSAAHASIHSNINVDLCRKNYRPGFWTPHCSLATSIDLAKKKDALAVVDQSIDPVEVTFDAADCASFMPVRVLRESTLK